MVRRKKGNVGIVGLGTMGGAFAKNLAAAGWQVMVTTSAPASRREPRAGVEIARHAELAAAVPTILTSLPSPASLDGPCGRSPPPSCRRCFSK